MVDAGLHLDGGARPRRFGRSLSAIDPPAFTRIVAGAVSRRRTRARRATPLRRRGIVASSWSFLLGRCDLAAHGEHGQVPRARGRARSRGGWIRRKGFSGRRRGREASSVADLEGAHVARGCGPQARTPSGAAAALPIEVARPPRGSPSSRRACTARSRATLRRVGTANRPSCPGRAVGAADAADRRTGRRSPSRAAPRTWAGDGTRSSACSASGRA